MSPALLHVRREMAIALARSLSKETGIPVDDILGRSKDAVVLEVRHRLWSMLIDKGLSSVAVGKVVERNHATILHGVRLHRERSRARLAGAPLRKTLGPDSQKRERGAA